MLDQDMKWIRYFYAFLTLSVSEPSDSETSFLFNDRGSEWSRLSSMVAILAHCSTAGLSNVTSQSIVHYCCHSIIQSFDIIKTLMKSMKMIQVMHHLYLFIQLAAEMKDRFCIVSYLGIIMFDSQRSK